MIPNRLDPADIEELGAALCTAREILTYTPAALGQAAVVAEVRILAFEAGTAVPTPEELERIWRVLADDMHSVRVIIPDAPQSLAPTNGASR